MPKADRVFSTPQLVATISAPGCVYRKPYPGLLSEESAKLA
jgi:hypothetical protein